MRAPQGQAAVPSHWHVFRREEDGGTQYLLPIYHKRADAVAAVATLADDQREYGVDACQDHACQA